MQSDIKNQVEEFIEYWQIFMKNWIEFADRQTEILRNFIVGSHGYHRYGAIHKTIGDGFPEPYFGNPRNLYDNKIHAVFINLNPGRAGESQSHYKQGDYIRDFRNEYDNYHQTLNTWNNQYYGYLNQIKSLNDQFNRGEIARKDLKINRLLIPKPVAFGTMQWWNKYRAQWIEEFLKPDGLNYQIEVQHILGLELSPWHSKVFTDIESIDVNYCLDKVVNKAVLFSKQINNPWLREGNLSLVLSCGAGFIKILNNQEWKEITPDFLQGSWKVWRWKYDSDTAIINFHQTNTKGAVTLNFPDNNSNKNSLQEFLLKQLKSMLA